MSLTGERRRVLHRLLSDLGVREPSEHEIGRLEAFLDAEIRPRPLDVHGAEELLRLRTVVRDVQRLALAGKQYEILAATERTVWP